MSEIALTWSKIAGVGGIALFVLLMVFRDVIRKKIFPTLNSQHAYDILRLIIVCTFLVAVVGIGAWILIEVKIGEARAEQQRSQQRFFDNVLAAITANAWAGGDDEERVRRHRALEALLRDANASKEFVAAVARIGELLNKRATTSLATPAHIAQEKLRSGDVGPTVEVLREVASQSDSDAAEAHYLAGVLLESKGEFDAAIQEYVDASHRAGGEEKYLTKAVGLALNTGKLDVAQSLLASRLALASGGMVNDEQLALYTGLSALAKWYEGRLGDAENEFNRALALLKDKPSLVLASVLNDSSPIYRSRGLFHVSRERLSRAAQIYACLAGERDVRYLNTLLNLAAVYIQDGSYGNADAVVERVLAAVAGAKATDLPRRFLGAQTYVVRGNLFRAQEDSARAEQSLLKALALFHDIRAAWTFSQARAETYLGAVYLEAKSPDKAVAHLQNGLATNVRLFGLRHFETGYSFALLAAAAALKGDVQQATTYLNQARETVDEKMSASPQAARIREVEAQIYLRQGRLTDAESAMKGACSTYSSMPVPDPRRLSECYEAMRDVLLVAGHTADAAHAAEQALRARDKIHVKADANAVPKISCPT